MTNAQQRILTALAGIPLVLAISFAGGWPFVVLVGAASALAQREFYGLAEEAGVRPFVAAGILAGVVLVASPLAPALLLVVAIIGTGILLSLPFALSHDRPLTDVSVTLTGIVYPALLLTGATALRSGAGLAFTDREAFWIIVAILVLVWAADSFAYFVGKSFGRRALAPRVSPKKTWEGSLGGALGALLFAVILKVSVLGFLAWGHVVALAIICGGISQIGDLAESRLKRSVNAKDSGSLLPGHGGMLDRLDALLFAAPLAYLYFVLVAGTWLR
ncbi:MAG: phosphatidate cytidylyltransferase [Bacteroidota bacterium]